MYESLYKNKTVIIYGAWCQRRIRSDDGGTGVTRHDVVRRQTKTFDVRAGHLGWFVIQVVKYSIDQGQ